MLFAKKELKDTLSLRFSQRFAHHIGRYWPASNDVHIDLPKSIEISACYALLGENSKHAEHDLDTLKQTAKQLIRAYHHRTGYWLSQEQIAFAAIWQHTRHEATTLKERFKHQNILLSTLNHNDSPSLLHLALLADALQIKHIGTSGAREALTKPRACHRVLNLPLDDTSMTEIESIGREVRESCEAAYLRQGTDLEDLQTSWRLKLRYEGCKNSLMLKCMPIEMLREVFETQHFKKYGPTDESRVIVIDELEIEVRLIDTTPLDAKKSNFYIEQWMSQWQPNSDHQNNIWSKQESLSIQQEFSWLTCPILAKMLTALTIKQADLAIPDFFMKNNKKEVDETIIRN